MLIARADWPRLLSLVEQALDLPATERDGWLRALDLSDELKLALRGLLDERRAIETEDFLVALPPIIDPRDPLDTSVPGRLQPGTLIGPWRLLREIGQGGMSTVWLAARADEQVTRQVALKLPHAGPGQDLLAARLLRERNILAALEHRNIARLYDVGLTEAGTPYLVMEYVAGDTLLAHADRLKLGVPQRLRLFQQVLRAVQYAHGKLVLHRDLKPSNILVNEAGDVKLLDFGIAKVLAAEGHTHDETELTRSAGRQLTPAYASPEQLRGEALGTASDIFSLGVLLYELLSGQRPFAAGGGSAAQLEDAVLHREAKAPSRLAADAAVLAARACSAPQLKSALAGDLDAIVLKSLNKLPTQRYAAVETLAADVAHWLADEPVSAQAPSGWYHLRKFVLRHRLGVGLGAGVTALLVLSSTVAVVQGVKAREEARRANASRDFLLGIFEDTNPEASTGRDLSAKQILERSRAKLLALAQQDPALPVPDLLNGIAAAQLRLGDRLGTVATLESLLATLPESGARSDRFAAHISLAEETAQLNELAVAKGHLQHALDDMGNQAIERRQLRQLAHAAGLVAINDSGRASVAKQALEAYFQLADVPDSAAPWTRLSARLNLAKAESLLGNREAALKNLTAAREFVSRHHSDLEPGAEFRPVSSYRASLDGDWGQYAQALAWLPAVIKRCTQAQGPSHDACLDLTTHAVRALLKTGHATSAARMAHALQAQADNPLSPRKQVEATSLMLRAFAFGGQQTDRERLQRRLETLVSPNTGAGLAPSLRLQGMNTLAEVSLLLGRPGNALSWTGEARRLQATASLSPATREVMKTSLFEGIALQMQGHHRSALIPMAPFCDENRLAKAQQYAVLDRLFSMNCVQSLAAVGERNRAQRLIQQALPVLRPALGEASPTFIRTKDLLDPHQAAQPKTALPVPFFFS